MYNKRGFRKFNPHRVHQKQEKQRKVVSKLFRRFQQISRQECFPKIKQGHKGGSIT